MDKRYQVFVSSTYTDLIDERKEVMQALLELDCIPSGMELFPAANESQWDLIKRVIDDCDYYLVIVAGRYGDCDNEGLGYTEKEYRYALDTKKPIIGFLHERPGDIIAGKSESTDGGKRKLEAFRELVKGKPCKFWDTPEKLGSVVSRSIVLLIKQEPGVGWVRADNLAGPEATSEILALRKQIEALKLQIERARKSPPKGAERLAQGEEEFRLHFAGVFGGSENSKYLSFTWNQLFSTIAPLMINEATSDQIIVAFERMIRDSGVDEYFDINDEDYRTILVQLRALGLIQKSEKPRSVKDVETYWTLTPYGDETMTRLIALKKGEKEESDTSEDSNG